MLALVAGTSRGFSLFMTLLTFFGFEVNHGYEHEFDVEVELGMSGLRVNYTMSNASSVIVWKVIVVIT